MFTKLYNEGDWVLLHISAMYWLRHWYLFVDI